MKTTDRLIKAIEKIRSQNKGEGLSSLRFWVNIDTFSELLSEAELEKPTVSRSDIGFNIPDSVLMADGVRFLAKTDRLVLQMGYFFDILTKTGYCPIFVNKSLSKGSLFVERLKPIANSIIENPQDLHSI